MKRILNSLFFIAIALLMSNCASIVSKSSYPMRIDTNPADAKVTITNRHSLIIFEGKAPASLMLNASAGFFQPEIYSVKIERDGYVPRTVSITADMDGWFCGNILVGGPLGMIIDAATGAMYKIEPGIYNITLQKETVGLENLRGIQIMDINDVPEEWKDHLIKIEQN